MKIKLSIFFLFLFLSATVLSQPKKLVLGADRLIPEYIDALKFQKIGLVTNKTGVLSNGNLLYEELLKKGLDVKLIFTPEHGFNINSEAGKIIKDSKSPNREINLYSLYGENKKPRKEYLKDITVLIYDIQDVGARFYTYISTLYNVLQAAAENNITVFILDRPNPITGEKVDGPVITDSLRSFVGIVPVPIQYGMTDCELAWMMSKEGWLGKNLEARTIFVTMKYWDRKSFYNDYNLKWLPPSPNMPDVETAEIYPGTCLLEGTNISEGRGTVRPFLTIGAPFIDPQDLIDKLEYYELKGIKLLPLQFTPKKIPGISENPKYEGELCNGLSLKITDRNNFKPVEFGIKLISALRELYPDNFKFTDYFDKLSGDASIRENILNGVSPKKIIESWAIEINEFKNIRNKYLLY
ncbi:MAG TPA: DUF1343 domain-containing protein [Ignavibacteriaceae bacterium]|nr:DUF1343 domain-containing protein [Ignavibacteriaceae bacterium]